MDPPTGGDLEAAYQHYLRAADLAAAIGFTWWQSVMLSNALELGLRLGLDVEAAGVGVLRLASRTEDRVNAIWALTGLAHVQLGRGEFEQAGRTWGAVAGAVESDPIDHGQPGFSAYSAPLREVADTRFLQGASKGRADGIWTVAAELLDQAQPGP